MPTTKTPPGSLPSAFTPIWVAHTVSQFGGQVTLLALPLTAITLLHANPWQLGLLAALGSLPNLLLSLPAGVWVDRVRKRRLMIAADLLRAALLILTVWLARTAHLTVPALLAAAFLIGSAPVCFDLAASATLPALLGRDQLLAGNSRMEASRSAASITGPTLAGLLIQGVGAARALSADALSFVLSALLLVRLPEPHAAPAPLSPPSALVQAREGLRALMTHPLLRALVRSMGLWNIFVGVGSAVHILFITQQLHLTPAQLGVVFTLQGLGMLAGTALAGPLLQRFLLGAVLMAFGGLTVLTAFGVVTIQGLPPGARFPALAVNELVSGVGYMVFAILLSTCRQAATPDALQGRMAAAFRFVIQGGLPLGAVLGGAVGSRWSLTAALLITAAGMLAAWMLLLPTPVPRLSQLPEPE